MQRIGVLALQGDVSEHIAALERAMRGQGEVVEIRKPGQMEQCPALVLPGGESTAIFRQLERSGLTGELKAACHLRQADTCHLCRVGAGLQRDRRRQRRRAGQATRFNGHQDQPECLRAAEGVL